ncbi:MAG TPA: tetratricopeptide repeat-containing glycosyltransferase family protein [Rhodocyclaceae bacterium]
MAFLDLLFRRDKRGDAFVGGTERAAEVEKNRGNEHLAKGELEEAARCYEDAIRIYPGYAEAHVNLGHVRREQKAYAESEQLLLRAIALKPSLWQAHLNLGRTAEDQRQFDEAAACYRHVIGLRPSYLDTHSWPEAHWRLATVFAEQERHEDALRVLDQMLTINPEWAEVRCNRGTALNKLGRNEEALAEYQRALSQNPENPAIVARFIGIVYEDMGQLDDALAWVRRARALDPKGLEGQIEEALMLLLRGDFENGWPAHEAMLPNLLGRKKGIETDAQYYRRVFTPERYWTGDDLGGGTLLLWTEQGLGDSLMMLRYLPLIKAHGAGRIVIICEQALVRIFRSFAEVDEILVKRDSIDQLRFDRHCSTMSLPFLFRTRLDTIPNRMPYISVPEGVGAKWRSRLAGYPGLKIGIAWGGNPTLVKDRERSIPLARFAPLMSVPGITWVSLQKGEPASQLKALAWPVVDWMDECDDMQDTAGLIDALDLVVSVDTSVVHLAGALAKPVWLLNRFGSEWRWMLEREDSPWYPSLRIFRQPSRGDWESVLARVAAELRNTAAR